MPGFLAPVYLLNQPACTQGAVWSCVLNDTALLAATASADFSVKIWDALSGDEKHMFQHKHIMRTVQFARDGIHVVSGGTSSLLPYCRTNLQNYED